MTRRIHFWKALIFWTWFGSAGIVLIGFVLHFLLPCSPGYNSVKVETLLATLNDILYHYVPYLAIILAWTFSTIEIPQEREFATLTLPLGIFYFSILYNLFILLVVFGTISDLYSSVTIISKFISLLNTGFAFLIAWYLTKFFQSAESPE